MYQNKRQPFQNNYEVIKPQSSALFSSQGNFITSNLQTCTACRATGHHSSHTLDISQGEQT